MIDKAGLHILPEVKKINLSSNYLYKNRKDEGI